MDLSNPLKIGGICDPQLETNLLTSGFVTPKTNQIFLSLNINSIYKHFRYWVPILILNFHIYLTILGLFYINSYWWEKCFTFLVAKSCLACGLVGITLLENELSKVKFCTPRDNKGKKYGQKRILFFPIKNFNSKMFYFFCN